MRIVLGSGSASRRAILEGAGVPFDVIRPAVDEEALKAGLGDLSPSDLALELARGKGASIEVPDALVIAADQVLEFQGVSYDKPKSMEELRGRLRQMSGRTHFLRGGCVIFRNGEPVAEICESSSLTMRDLTADEIGFYLETVGEDVLSTVGGYALEGAGARLFERIEGDFFSILGLPLLPVLEVLRREGALSF
jgi:septum formation protein